MTTQTPAHARARERDPGVRLPLEALAWPAVPDRLPTTMDATVATGFGDPDVLVTARLPVPEPGEDEVLVRVGAVGVGRTLDLAARAGRHPYPGYRFPHVFGSEHAGTVVALGSSAAGPERAGAIRVGDRVAVYPSVVCGECAACRSGRTEACSRLEIVGMHRQGADAEYAAVPAANVHVIAPATADAMDPATAAALALSGPVSTHQLREANLRAGDWVVVQGATSALASVTAALAVHLGARVIGTSRSPAKRAVLEGLGLSAVLDSGADDLTEQVLELTGGAGVAVVVDDLGDPGLFAVSTAVLATLGTVVTSGAFLGPVVPLDLGRLYLRSQRVVGVRTGTSESVGAFWREVDAGFRPPVDAAFPLERAAEAHRHVESDTGIGRVVLVPPGGLGAGARPPGGGAR